MSSVVPLPPTLDELVAAVKSRLPETAVVSGRRFGRRHPDGPQLLIGGSGRGWKRGVASVDGFVRTTAGLTRFTFCLPLPSPGPHLTPADFRVVAVLAIRNEGDFIGWVLDQLMDAERIHVYVIDNHSVDGTHRALRDRQTNPRFLGWETWPAEPDDSYDWAGLLQRKQEVAANLDASWAIHSDGDEVRRSPWPRSSLRDAIWLADLWGANLLDFTVVNHLPVAEYTPSARTDVTRLDHVELGLRPGYFRQKKAWRRPAAGATVPLLDGGHTADVPDPVVFPLNFRVDHYPVRSQHHGQTKILQSLRLRAARERAERGWHTHYDHVSDEHRFERPAGSLPVDSPDFARMQAGRLLFRAGMVPDPRFAIV